MNPNEVLFRMPFSVALFKVSDYWKDADKNLRTAFDARFEAEKEGKKPIPKPSLNYIKVQFIADISRRLQGLPDHEENVSAIARRDKDHCAKYDFLEKIGRIQATYSKMIQAIFMMASSPLWALPVTTIAFFVTVRLAMEADSEGKDPECLCDEVYIVMKSLISEISPNSDDLEKTHRLMRAFFDSVSLGEQDKTNLIAGYAASQITDENQAHTTSLPFYVMQHARRMQSGRQHGSYSMRVIEKLMNFSASCVMHREQSLRIAKLAVTQKSSYFVDKLKNISIHGYTVKPKQEVGLRLWSEEMQAYDFWNQVATVGKIFKSEGEFDPLSFLKKFFDDLILMSSITVLTHSSMEPDSGDWNTSAVEQNYRLVTYFQESLRNILKKYVQEASI